MDVETIKNEDLGWDEFFEAKKTEMNLGDLAVARVIAEHRGLYKVKNEKGEYAAKITGKQMFEAESREDYPAVGDWVAITELGNDQAVIKSILPRKSIIKRRSGDKNRIGEKSDVQVIATNIDVAFIVESLGRDYNVNRLERYMAISKDEGIRPVVILNKIDLISSEELNLKIEEIKNRLGDVDIIATSARSDEGISKLIDYIKPGKTYCFLGSSGVGKSSLINKLLGKSDIETKEISTYSERGKHTTTAREMYFLPARQSSDEGGASGGIVIDNPGIREVGMTDTGTGVAELYDEIEKLTGDCKFSDCTHTNEPGCAVLAAVEEGKLERERYVNYINLKKETAYYDMAKQEKREKDRNFGKFMKKTKKDLREIGYKDF